jgi:cytochrome c2
MAEQITKLTDLKSVLRNADMNTFKYTICSALILGTIISFSLLFSACSMTYSGEKLFFKEGCSQCHTFKGKGGRMGPDLSAVTNLKTDKWIDSYMQNPKSMYPFARMPSFKHLSSSKRKAIITFLKN